jgi:ketosteroid isomerase-like protein
MFENHKVLLDACLAHGGLAGELCIVNQTQKHVMKAIITLAALLFTAPAFAQSKTDSEIIALSKKRVQWLLAGNLDSLKNLYDENSITVHTNGLIKTAAEHFEDIRQGRPTYKSIDIKENTVREFGNTAILIGKGVFNIAMNGQAMTYNMVYTEVYQKKNGQWKLISRQASTAQ